MAQYHDPDVPPVEVPDHNLVGAVRHALGINADVDTSAILVDAANGVVNLTGAVTTLYQKRVAGRIADAARGVKRVDNNLVVVPDKQPTDEEIACALDRVLGNYPASQPKKIGVRLVEDGIAYLAGTASDALEAWRAADEAAKVPGVKDVINEIDIAPGEPVSDISIKNRVIDALSEDPRVDPFSIDVNVDDADVYLSGDVEDEEARYAAGELASSAPGVKRVYNKLNTREK